MSPLILILIAVRNCKKGVKKASSPPIIPFRWHRINLLDSLPAIKQH